MIYDHHFISGFVKAANAALPISLPKPQPSSIPASIAAPSYKGPTTPATPATGYAPQASQHFAPDVTKPLPPTSTGGIPETLAAPGYTGPTAPATGYAPPAAQDWQLKGHSQTGGQSSYVYFDPATKQYHHTNSPMDTDGAESLSHMYERTNVAPPTDVANTRNLNPQQMLQAFNSSNPAQYTPQALPPPPDYVDHTGWTADKVKDIPYLASQLQSINPEMANALMSYMQNYQGAVPPNYLHSNTSATGPSFL